MQAKRVVLIFFLQLSIKHEEQLNSIKSFTIELFIKSHTMKTLLLV